jgi:HlyD family secretion protein
MIRRTSSWFLCIVASLSLVGLAFANEFATKKGEPAAKTGKQDAKTEKPAAKSDKPAAKTDKPADKKTESPAKGGKPAAKPSVPNKDKKCAEKSEASPPATHTVKKGPLKVTFDLDGVFEAQTAHEILVKPEEWNALTVETSVAHGARVRKGDVLVSLDPEKLDQAIADLRADLKLSEISLQLSEDQLKTLDKTTPLDLEQNARAARVAEEDRKYFMDVGRPFTLKMIEFSLKMANQSLEYEQEELRQLEKMYKADDITEETEQIVLKRARDTVERAKFMVEYVKLNCDHALKFTLPRTEESVKEAAQRRSLDQEKSKLELPLILQRQRLELEKLRVQRERTNDRLKKLLADRELMTIRSPADGIVYYGKCTRGRFGDSTGMAESLRRYGSIMPNQVIMTVVQSRPMVIRASAAEEHLHWLRPGIKGLATPTGYPDLKLATTLDDTSDIPVGPGSFDTRFSVTLGDKTKWLMPNMTCKVKLTPYLKKDALIVPPKVVLTDDLDDQKRFVWVLPKDGKPQRRDVTVGEKTEKDIEILKGLSDGEKVLLEPPKDEK